MKDFSHGYLLVGDKEAAYEAAMKMAAGVLLANADMEALTTHPDFSVFDGPQFAIEDARAMKESVFKKSFDGKGRVFVMVADFFTKEAMNALLKTFEEPVPLAHFFIITPSADNILPTLRSRLVLLKFPRPEFLSKEKNLAILKFLKMPPSKRVEIAKKMSEEKDRDATFKFLEELELFLSLRLRQKINSPEIVFGLEEIIKQKERLLIPGASLKLILEHLCFILPVLSS